MHDIFTLTTITAGFLNEGWCLTACYLSLGYIQQSGSCCLPHWWSWTMLWVLDLFRLMEGFLFLCRSSFPHESCSRVMKWLNHGNGSHTQASRCQKAPQAWPIQPPETKWLEKFPRQGEPRLDMFKYRCGLYWIPDMTSSPTVACICSILSPSCWARMFSALAGLCYGFTWAQGPFNLKFISQSECWGKLSQGIMRYGGQSKLSCLSVLLKGR